MSKEKDSPLAIAAKQIEKEFGKGSFMRLGDAPVVKVDVIPTGSLMLDKALGVGGLPRGRIIECFGPEAAGKSSMALHIVAEAQKLGGEAAYIDAEHSFDPSYAARIGVDVENLWFSQPNCGEEALNITEKAVSAGAAIVVVDSVAALTPRAELEGQIGDSHVGLQARLMGQAMRMLNGRTNNAKSMILFINQIRDKVGVMFGSPETTTGGRALKFYASVRLDIRRIGAIKDGNDVVGNRTRVKVVKNKVAPPFKEAEFDIIYGEGICTYSEVLDLAVENGLVTKGGTWFTVGETKLQGRESVKSFLKENPEVFENLKSQVRSIIIPA